MLRFLGRRSAFNEEQNSAFFVEDERLVLLDCAMFAFHAVRKTGLEGFGDKINEIVIVVTHTHGDHISGIPMMIHYAKYVLCIPVTVIVPTEEMRTDMRFACERLDGCDPDAYTMLTADEAISVYKWLKAAILTEHTPQLAGRCFGYNLSVDGRNVVYTGDTNTLEPFLPYLEKGSVLYTETSYNDSGVHLHVKKLIEYAELFKEREIEVYLMHMDDERAILEQVEGRGFAPAPLFSE